MSLTQAAALQNISQNKGATNIFGYTMLGLLGSFALVGGYAYVTKSTNQHVEGAQVAQGAQGAQGGKRRTRKRSTRKRSTRKHRSLRA
uniref:Uncharacterized protein n=1 Tax=viral metagenome TaxID=1070528 RepID=A0A6C0IIN1_9ZZZZ